ncbi:DNA primase [bacterium CG2_30_37_16]|nr:MAG: DNA primase [bacterium CG2_30_37_16]PIX98813.1 MAG: DNA primase [bacterium (Candidatus Howlettbacteria) CG_4_10_14_3_um_filter_37_10]PJB07473.1 MAG: DNA primase [bacterium (Candidatus Howlettbacteria) CG_4_9_14_3_um_filter_37_10]
MEDVLQEIKNRIDIVDFVSGYITVKKAGRNFKANCPFHQEKTPSFMVSPEKQIWHCFGCNSGGDVITFLMQIEGLSFSEAIEALAGRANVVLNKDKISPEKKGRKTNLYKINELACQIFEKLMYETTWGKEALSYYEKRGLTKATIKRFRLGVSPSGSNFLSGLLVKKGYTSEALKEAGIAKIDSGRVTDIFKNRLMFPILDISGKVIGFTARVFDKQLPKYINSAQSPIYNKSNVLYGLFEAKNSIREKGFAVVVEGNMDVLACFNGGIENVVASSGTAFTESQLNLLNRFTQNLKFAFDSDDAGVIATERGVEMALVHGFDVDIISLPFGKDPADILKKDKEAFSKAIENSQSAIKFYEEFGQKKYDIKSARGKKEYAKFILKKVTLLRDPVEKSHWVKEIAKNLDVDASTLKSMIGKESAVTGEKSTMPIVGRNLIEENLLGLTLKHPKFLSFVLNNLREDDLTADYQEIFLSLLTFKKKKFTVKSYAVEFPEKKDKINSLILQSEYNYGEITEEKAGDEILFSLKRLKDLSKKQKTTELVAAIKDAEEKDDKKLKKELLKEYNKLLISQKTF